MLKTINVREEIEKEVVGFGNGSIVYTPKKWLGKKVLVILEEKPLDIEGEVMESLKPYLSKVEGIFLYGSFARGEQTEKSDVDILVISNEKIGLKKRERFDFLSKTKEEFIGEMQKDPSLFLRQIVNEAKPIFNESLLRELRQVKVRPDFKEFFDSTLSAFKTIKELLEVDKKRGKKYADSTACIYSLILRLRGLFLIQLFKRKQGFSTRKFKGLIRNHGFKEKTISHFLEIYRAERDNKKIAHRVLLGEVEKLFDAAKMEFLKTEKTVKA